MQENLPNRTAKTRRAPKSRGYFGSYKEMGKSPKNIEHVPYFSTKTAAIYLGKMFRDDTLRDDLLFTIGFEREAKIYNREGIAALLEYMCVHSPEGENVRIIICRKLSELFNGPEDIEGTFESREQAEVLAYCLSRLPREKVRDLEIWLVDRVPANIALSRKLSASINPETNKVDVEKAYGVEGSTELSPDPDALAIAQFLYRVCKKNETLRKIFFKMSPARLRNEDIANASNYYGLTEVAIRLAAILSGEYIHAGVDRQGVYDELILKLVKGKKGNSEVAKIPELVPLFDLLDGKKFASVHVDTKRNRFRDRKSANLMAARVCVLGMLAAWLAAVAVGAKRYYCGEYPFESSAAADARPTSADASPSQTPLSAFDRTADGGF